MNPLVPSKKNMYFHIHLNAFAMMNIRVMVMWIIRPRSLVGDTKISEEPLFYWYFYPEDWNKVLIRNFNVGSDEKSVYKANFLVASFSSVTKPSDLFVCYVTNLPPSSWNTSGSHDTLARAALFPADVRSSPWVISHLVTTTSRFAIIFKRVAAKILPQRSEQTIIPRRRTPLVWSE